MSDKPRKPRPAKAAPPLRDLLFSDCSLKQWSETKGEGEPWLSFRMAKRSFDEGARRSSASFLLKLLEQKGLESRVLLQAWSFLRELETIPPVGTATDVLGVVVEVALPAGLDLLAGYADGTARYYNFSGAGVIWEHPDGSLDEPVKSLLEAGQAVVDRTGPWTSARPAPPPEGQSRLNMLTRGGLYFGQGPTSTVASDELSGPVFGAALQLMKALVDKSRSR